MVDPVSNRINNKPIGKREPQVERQVSAHDDNQHKAVPPVKHLDMEEPVDNVEADGKEMATARDVELRPVTAGCLDLLLGGFE